MFIVAMRSVRRPSKTAPARTPRAKSSNASLSEAGVSVLKRRQILIGAAGALAVTGGGVWSWSAASGSMSDYERYSDQLRALPAEGAGSADLVRSATLAANSHNTQPWKFHAAEDGDVRLLPDFGRRLSVVDPDDHHLFVSLGCAAENFSIAARALGWSGETSPDPQDGLRVQLSKAVAAPEPLFDAIFRRQSTRALYDGRAAPPQELAALAEAGARPSVRLTLLTDRAQIGRLRDLAVAGNDVQLSDPAFLAELKSWLRFNPRSAMATGDGLFSAASGNPVMPSWIGRRLFDLVFTAQSENDKLARQIDSSAGVAVFVGDAADSKNWIEVGRACQRFLLTATHLGLKCAFINQPVEVARLRPELAALIGEAGKRPDLVVRFGYGPTMPYAPRRPVGAVRV